MSTEHSHTGPRGTIYHIHIDDTPPDGPLAEREEYTIATEEELEYEATIATLRDLDADLIAALDQCMKALQRMVAYDLTIIDKRALQQAYDTASDAIASAKGETEHTEP